LHPSYRNSFNDVKLTLKEACENHLSPVFCPEITEVLQWFSKMEEGSRTKQRYIFDLINIHLKYEKKLVSLLH